MSAKPQFSYDIGYYGKVQIGNQGLLATGGNISVQYSPIFTTGVWGAYWKNVTDKIAYAPNYITLSGSVNYQLTANIATQLQNFAFEQRNQAKKCTIYPNGVAGYSGDMWCTGCGFSTSQDSLVTGDISLKSGNVASSISTTNNTSDTNNDNSSFVSSISAGYRDVFPYWGTGVYLTALNDTSTRKTPEKSTTQINDIIDWSASYSSQLVFVACCNYASSMLQADYCCLGSMQAQGSFTMFRIGSYLQPANIQKHNSCSISMQPASGASGFDIMYGAIIWTGASTDVQTGSSLIQSSFNWSALGNTSEPPMKFYSSQSSPK